MVYIEGLSGLRSWRAGAFGQVVEQTLDERGCQLVRLRVSLLRAATVC